MKLCCVHASLRQHNWLLITSFQFGQFRFLVRICRVRRLLLLILFLIPFGSPACRVYEFSCATAGQCVPQAWRCDGETDCRDGSDERQCGAPCDSGQVPCVSGDQCVDYQQLCDGTPHCRDASDESIDNCGRLILYGYIQVYIIRPEEQFV